MELDEAIRRVSTIPARFLHMEDRTGTPQPGPIADLVVTEFVEGEFELVDAFDVTETGGYKLEPRLIFRAGQQVGVVPHPGKTN